MCEKANIFFGLKILVLPNLVAKKRLSLFQNQVELLGGEWCILKDVQGGKQEPSHIIVEDSLFKDTATLTNALSAVKFSALVVKLQWLSDCLKLKKLIPTQSYESNIKHTVSDDCVSPSKKCKLTQDSSASNILEESEVPGKSTDNIAMKFVCSQAAPSIQKQVPEGNKIIIQELQKLADAFRCKGDTWRAHGYSKAISAIERCNSPITSYEEAVALPGVGTKIASKVWELLESGSLQKVSEICNNEKANVLELFNGVWGVGPSTAESWFQLGCRTLKDLEEKVTLTRQQQIGLKYYDDFQTKIPRTEVELVGQLVAKAASNVDKLLVSELVGSYRRGKDLSGDIDVMVCKPDHMKSKDILSQIISLLKDEGLVTDDLIAIENNGNQRKYFGVCRLPGTNQVHRRLDIFVVPRSELATATMHYTGSARFNRSIRLLASKKGMSLSEHNLLAGVVREGTKKLSSGYVVETPTEESIFKALGLDYLPPEERNH